MKNTKLIKFEKIHVGKETYVIEVPESATSDEISNLIKNGLMHPIDQTTLVDDVLISKEEINKEQFDKIMYSAINNHLTLKELNSSFDESDLDKLIVY